MSEFNRLFSAFVFAAIIFIGMFTFIIQIQNDNDSPQKMVNNTVFNGSFNSLNLAISNATEESQDKYKVFDEENPSPGIGSIILFGIVSVGKTFSSLMFGFFWALIKLPLIVLGIPVSIYSLVLMWLILLVIVSAWLLYKLGG